jgi:hypothetical protein
MTIVKQLTTTESALVANTAQFKFNSPKLVIFKNRTTSANSAFVHNVPAFNITTAGIELPNDGTIVIDKIWDLTAFVGKTSTGTATIEIIIL